MLQRDSSAEGNFHSAEHTRSHKNRSEQNRENSTLSVSVGWRANTRTRSRSLSDMDETFRSRQDSHEADLKDIYDIDWAHDASLLIANLTPQVQENHLSEIVGCYGDVENIRLKRVCYMLRVCTSSVSSIPYRRRTKYTMRL